MATLTCEFVPTSAREELAAATDHLHRALAGRLIGREPRWADDLGSALRQTMSALRGHIATAKVQRKAADWRREQFQLLEQICTLQKGIAEVTQAFSRPPYTAFGRVLKNGEKLVRALRQHLQKEAASRE